jgi:hypothetical protein
VAEPRDDGPYNPYAKQTNANTQTGWLFDDNHKNIDADLDGMGDYAKNMKIIADNLMGNIPELNLMAELPSRAWPAGVLPESAYTAELMLRNHGELMQYLSYLQQAVLNVGSAAQTIAASYAGTDGWSAADLNSVNFAYGVSDKRPSGYPAGWMDQVKTYQEALAENMRTGNAAASGVHATWDDQGSYTDEAGREHHVAMSTDGVKREIITWTDPFTHATHTTTIVTYPPNPNGQTPQQRAGYSQTSSQISNTYLASNGAVVTSTTSYGNDGAVTGRQTQSTTYGNNGQVTDTSTTNYGADGKETSSNSTVTNADGSQTTTKTHGDGKDKETDQRVEVGPDTPGVVGLGDQPAQDALNGLRLG